MKKIFVFFWIGFIAIILLQDTTGCLSGCNESQWGYSNGEFDYFNINLNQKTPNGTPYDPSGLNISGQLIDRLTSEVNTCLLAAFPNGDLSDIAYSQGQCAEHKFSSINYSSFGVKIADNWVLSCDKTEQMLPQPVKAGPAGCFAKGQTDTSCPCRWRAGIKCDNVIIATPSFYLYKDALIRYVTTCRNPWANDKLAACATPTTTSLSDGSDPNNGINSK